jgi:hypothetical protein
MVFLGFFFSALLQHPEAIFLDLSDVGSPRLPKWIIWASDVDFPSL